MKTSELVDIRLDWAVSMALGITNFGAPAGRSEAHEFTLMRDVDPDIQYSSKWDAGGPIIDREKIRTQPSLDAPDIWLAQQGFGTGKYCYGPTLLIAAMRCFVASKLGDDVEIPEELK